MSNEFLARNEEASYKEACIGQGNGLEGRAARVCRALEFGDGVIDVRETTMASLTPSDRYSLLLSFCLFNVTLLLKPWFTC